MMAQMNESDRKFIESLRDFPYKWSPSQAGYFGKIISKYKTKKKMIVIHHNKDMDGYCSGAVCKLKYPDAKLIGWDYAEPIPDFEQFVGEDVIMIDITFPIAKIHELRGIVNTLTVIDHHISFFKDLIKFYGLDEDLSDASKDVIYTDENLKYVYELGIAACEIGWKYLFPDKRVPYAITLLGRYDTWRQNEGDWEKETLPFQYAMRVDCTSAETFPMYLLDKDEDFDGDAYIYHIVEQGLTVLKYQEQQDMLACQRSSFEGVVGGKNAICLNARAFSSNTMKSVYNPSKHDLMVGFEYTGTKWTVSLRSDKPEVDVSIIAKSKGGGGHKGAAGFEVNSFEEIFV